MTGAAFVRPCWKRSGADLRLLVSNYAFRLHGRQAAVSKKLSVARMDMTTGPVPKPDSMTVVLPSEPMERRRHAQMEFSRDPSVRYVPGGKSSPTRKAPSALIVTDRNSVESDSGSVTHSIGCCGAGVLTPLALQPARNAESVTSIASPTWGRCRNCR